MEDKHAIDDIAERYKDFKLEIFGYVDKSSAVDLSVTMKGKKQFTEKQATLLGTLLLIGVKGDEDVNPDFSSSIGLISELPTLGNLYYKGELIENFEFPKVGCERMTYKNLIGSEIVSEKQYEGNMINHYVMGARPKYDGTQGMVFHIVTKYTRFAVLWYELEIKVVSAERYPPCFLEYVNGVFKLLSGDCECFLNDMPVEKSEFEELTSDLIQAIETSRDVDGIVLMVDGAEFKCPTQRLVTFCATDKGMVDSQGAVYSLDKRESGFYDYCYVDRGWVFVRKRDDKVNADSTTAINIIRRSMVVLADLKTMFSMRKERRMAKEMQIIMLSARQQGVPAMDERARRLRESRKVISYDGCAQVHYDRLEKATSRSTLLSQFSNTRVSCWRLMQNSRDSITVGGLTVISYKHVKIKVDLYSQDMNIMFVSDGYFPMARKRDKMVSERDTCFFDRVIEVFEYRGEIEKKDVSFSFSVREEFFCLLVLLKHLFLVDVYGKHVGEEWLCVVSASQTADTYLFLHFVFCLCLAKNVKSTGDMYLICDEIIFEIGYCLSMSFLAYKESMWKKIKIK